MVYKFFDKKSTGSGVTMLSSKSAIKFMSNQQLADKLHKPIIKKFKRRKVYSLFTDNIWGVNLADMPLISKCNKEIKFLSCLIGLFSKYAWVIPLKGKKGNSIVNAFQKLLNDWKRKSNKIWVGQGSEFYNSSFKEWLKDNGRKMY